MRDVIALVVLSAMLGFVLGVMTWMVAPSEWHSDLHKNQYYPFTVELSVRDR